MADNQISAEWAWISKDPAEGIGYSVLATSAANVDFRPFIGLFVPGSPSSTTPEGAPDAPPWVTFGPVATEHDGVLMSVSVRDWWRERDHAGRPVWPQRLLVMPFADLAAAGASYQSMWAAAEHADIPRGDLAPLPLAVSVQPTGPVTATIERYGLDQLAGLAAALLDGPVVVSDAAPLARDERLAVLDAIAALLPYGFRAGLSVSSVVDNTVKHGIRLAFADYPGAGQQLRSLRTPAPPPGGMVGSHYLAALAEKVASRGLQAVVDHLWAFRRPCSFEHPGIAMAVLSELDFYGGFSRALRERRASREEVLKFFTEPVQAKEYWADFDPQMRENAISPYLADRDEDVMTAVLRCWEFTRHEVVRAVNHRLGIDGPGFGLWCLQTARAVPADGPVDGPADGPSGSLADQLLGKMLVPVGLPAEDYSRRIMILVQLMLQCPVPAPKQLQYSCDELRFGDLRGWQANLVRELLTQEIAASAAQPPADRVGSWIKWFSASPFSVSSERPVWVAALDFMPSPSTAADQVKSVIRDDPAWAVVLLQLAERFRRFRRLIELADRQLIELAAQLPAPAQPGGPGAALHRQLDRNLWKLGVEPATVAAVDVVRVLLGGPPRDLADRLTEADLDRYGDGLHPALALDVVAPRRSMVEHGFLRHVMGHKTGTARVWLLNAWACDPERVMSLGDFIATLEPRARPFDEGLSDAYWEALSLRPDLAGYAATQQLVNSTRQSVLAQPAVFRRKIIDYGVTSTPLARACLRARRAGLGSAGIVTALANGGADRIAPRQLDDVLREWAELLTYSYLDAPAATERAARPGQRKAGEADLLECQALIALGGLGETYGQDYRQYLVQRLRQESRAQRRLARILARAGRKRAQADPGRWVHSVVQTGIGATRRPWYQRGEDHVSRA
jgi:hypothetical protein